MSVFKDDDIGKEFKKRQILHCISASIFIFFVVGVIALEQSLPELYENVKLLLFIGGAFLFGLVLLFGLKNWRCPSCNVLLGRNLCPGRCPKCGQYLTD